MKYTRTFIQIDNEEQFNKVKAIVCPEAVLKYRPDMTGIDFEYGLGWMDDKACKWYKAHGYTEVKIHDLIKKETYEIF